MYESENGPRATHITSRHQQLVSSGYIWLLLRNLGEDYVDRCSSGGQRYIESEHFYSTRALERKLADNFDSFAKAIQA